MEVSLFKIVGVVSVSDVKLIEWNHVEHNSQLLLIQSSQIFVA